MAASDELKSCPFCGGEDIAGDNFIAADYAVSCRTCSAAIWGATTAKAREMWNHRAPAPPSGTIDAGIVIDFINSYKDGSDEPERLRRFRAMQAAVLAAEEHDGSPAAPKEGK